MNTLNQFITVQLSPEVLAGRRGRLQLYQEQVQAAKKMITRQLRAISYLPAGSVEKETFIQALQLDTARQLDVLYCYRLTQQSVAASDGSGDELTLFYLRVEGILQDVLIGLEQHFSGYLAPDLALPLSYAARVRPQLQVRLNELEVLMDRLGLDGPLTGLMLRPVREFLHSGGENLSFRSLTYYRELLSQLYVTGTLEMALPDSFRLQVHAILLHLNFNAVEYYLYCINELRSLLKGCSHLHGRIAFLSWCIREIKRVPLKGSTVALDPGGENIAHQLGSWLEEERAFLRHLNEEDPGRTAAARQTGQEASTPEGAGTGEIQRINQPVSHAVLIPRNGKKLSMKTSLNELKIKLDAELAEVEIRKRNVLERFKTAARVADGAVEEMKQLVLGKHFESEEDEIYYFKHILPCILGKKIYYSRLFRIEANHPKNIRDDYKKYLDRELQRINMFFEEHNALRLYYEGGGTDKDELYFRGNSQYSNEYPVDLNGMLDTRFCTVIAFILAELTALQDVRHYLFTKLDQLDGAQRNMASKSKLRWTDSKTDLVELVYALFASGCFNSGKAELKQIFEWLEDSLEIDFGNAYGHFRDIRLRKKETASFLNRIKDSLLKRIGELRKVPRK